MNFVGSVAALAASWGLLLATPTLSRYLEQAAPQAPALPFSDVLHISFASFEALREPLQAERELLGDTRRDTAASVYFDAALAEQRFAAAYRVTVVSATRLPDSGLFWIPSSSFVELSIAAPDGGSYRKTSVKVRTAAPRWDETFTLWAQRGAPGATELSVRVLNKAPFSADSRPRGSAVLPLTVDACADATVTLPLTGAGGGGTITLRVQVLPVGAPCSTSSPLGQALAERRVPSGFAELAAALPGPLVGLRTAAFVRQDATDTELYISWAPEQRKVIVALRGSEDGLVDAPTDFMISLTPHAEPGAGRVFKGIYNAWRTVSPYVSAIVDALTENDPTWSIDVTGHSLGGGLATVASFELAAKYPETRMVTFGGPQMGDTVFKAAFEARVPDAWRVVTQKDPVPRLPDSVNLPFVTQDYEHVGRGLVAFTVAEERLCTLDAPPGDVVAGAAGLDAAKFRSHVTDTCPYDPPQAYALFSLSTLLDAPNHGQEKYIGGLFSVARAAAADEATRAQLAAAEALAPPDRSAPQ